LPCGTQRPWLPTSRLSITRMSVWKAALIPLPLSYQKTNPRGTPQPLSIDWIARPRERSIEMVRLANRNFPDSRPASQHYLGTASIKASDPSALSLTFTE
jgi:hypothetical protein